MRLEYKSNAELGYKVNANNGISYTKAILPKTNRHSHYGSKNEFIP